MDFIIYIKSYIGYFIYISMFIYVKNSDYLHEMSQKMIVCHGGMVDVTMYVTMLVDRVQLIDYQLIIYKPSNLVGYNINLT